LSGSFFFYRGMTMATYTIHASVTCNYDFTISANSEAEAEEAANEYLAENYLVMDCDSTDIAINQIDKE